jgi:hypothetical protein
LLSKLGASFSTKNAKLCRAAAKLPIGVPAAWSAPTARYQHSGEWMTWSDGPSARTLDARLAGSLQLRTLTARKSVDSASASAWWSVIATVTTSFGLCHAPCQQRSNREVAKGPRAVQPTNPLPVCGSAFMCAPQCGYGAAGSRFPAADVVPELSEKQIASKRYLELPMFAGIYNAKVTWLLAVCSRSLD